MYHMKRTIFKIERDQTKAGRTINALLALLTANRYALIFTFRLTLVKRAYQPENMRRRVKENLFIFLVLFPLALSLVVMNEKCSHQPSQNIMPSDTTRIQNPSHQTIEPDCVCDAPSLQRESSVLRLHHSTQLSHLQHRPPTHPLHVCGGKE